MMQLQTGAAILCAGLFACALARAAEDSRVSRVENGLLPIATAKLGERRSIEDRMRDYGVTGLSVAVVDEGKIAWAKGYGDGRFRLGSTRYPAHAVSSSVDQQASQRDGSSGAGAAGTPAPR